MKIETLLILLAHSPEKIKANHPFWKKLIKEGIKLDQGNVKIKDLREKLEYFKSGWRNYKNLIIDFYSYLKLNFPNPIPFPLFFLFEEQFSRTDYDIYQEDEFGTVDDSENSYEESKQSEYIQFDESIHHSENTYSYNNDDYNVYYEDDFVSFEEWESYEDSMRENLNPILINLADKWLKDILSGESFYDKNKEYFTRNEVKHFLTCDWVKIENKISNMPKTTDFFNYYWKTKINANDLHSLLTPDFFINKFYEHNGNILIIKYFKFICTYKRFIRDFNEIQDFCDYIFSDRFIDDFDTMTWLDLRHLSDEWHEGLHINDPLIKVINLEWKKNKDINDFIFENDNNKWTIEELTTSQSLFGEGEEMRNCVSSYAHSCYSRKCMIFSVKHNDKRKATLEISKVNSEYQLVQSRGKYNSSIKDEETKNVIDIWAKENKIKIQESAYIPPFMEDEDVDFYDNMEIANNDETLDELENEFYERLYSKYDK